MSSPEDMDREELLGRMPSSYSVAEFIARTSERDHGQGFFERESEQMLEINLLPHGRAWIRKGAMVAYQGKITFKREGVLEHGLGRALKKSLSGEGVQLTKAEGAGKVYVADQGKTVLVLRLDGDALSVNGPSLLAFQDSVKWDIHLMRKVAGMLSGGLFNVRLEGKGMIALTSHFTPLTLKVSPGKPVVTDPNATIAWSANLKPELKLDVSLKTFFGRGSGESIQMKFDGDGFVVVQPFEEVPVKPGM